MPLDTNDLLASCTPVPPLLRLYVSEVSTLIQKAVEDPLRRSNNDMYELDSDIQCANVSNWYDSDMQVEASPVVQPTIAEFKAPMMTPPASRGKAGRVRVPVNYNILLSKHNRSKCNSCPYNG